MTNLLTRTQMFCKRNAGTILTYAGGVGLISTVILAVKATPKAMRLLEDAKESKEEELTNWDVVRIAGPAYIPTAITGTATLACIFGANVLNKRQQAALMSAYALVDNKFKEYKEKLKELHGEEAHQEIVNAIAVEKAGDVYVHSECLCTSCDLSTEENDGEPKLFYDEHSNRYFEATIEQVMQAEYHLNRNFVLRGYTTLNEFYEFLGLATAEYGDTMGWAVDDSLYWIDFSHNKVTLEDGLECYIIETPWGPSMDFLEYYY